MKQIALSVAFMACSLPGMAKDLNFAIGHPDDIISLVAIVMALGLPMFIVFMVLWFGYKNKQAKYRLASEALASGRELPKELFRSNNGSAENKDILSKGIKNIFLGIGLTVLLWLLTATEGIAAIGFLVFCMGLGQVVVAYATRDKQSIEDRPTTDTALTPLDRE